jgi:hypothetical protein
VKSPLFATTPVLCAGQEESLERADGKVRLRDSSAPFFIYLSFGARAVRRQDDSDPKEDFSMQYMLLIWNDESQWAKLSEDEGKKLMGEYFAFTTELRESGAFVAGDPLEASRSASTVRLRNGDQAVTDGPYAETKEQLGGYYVIDVDSQDEAVKWAGKIPAARTGAIEVRPVRSM